MIEITSLKIILVVLYVLTTIPFVIGNCNVTFNTDLCKCDLYCEQEVINPLPYNSFSHQNIRNTYGGISFNCRNKAKFLINLIYKEHSYSYYRNRVSFNDMIPNTQLGENFFHYIDLFDLSNNYYKSLPTIRSMPNLIFLNLSNNFLEVGKLTNKYSLDSLKEIDLSNNMINTLEINQDEVSYQSLESINLSYNLLELLPETVFEKFSNLIKLDLSHNSLIEVNPNTFEGLKDLQYLNMSHNKLTDINASLFRFRSLQLLDLSYNLIYHVNSIDFVYLTTLYDLNLESNLISTINKEALVNLNHLNSLNLKNNKIELLPNDVFNSLSELKIILLAKNKLKSLPISMFKGKTIQCFSIVENELEGSLVRGMFEGMNVDTLDLSNQKIDTVENNAFFGISSLLKVLLLQNNIIRKLSPKSFYMLHSLKQLDLSNNEISDIGFQTEDLINLESLSIRNNNLSIIKPEFFQNLDSLQLLDLSYNKISWIESNSFESLNKLISFDISKNPLNLTLEQHSFTGLSSLPSFDISYTSLETVKNRSFDGMLVLKNLNMSHNKLNSLQYNSFLDTGAIEILDLSYNKLPNFLINNTHLQKLNILYLNNNFIFNINCRTFGELLGLTKIFLSYNKIESIEVSTFENQTNLKVLDISYNVKLVLDASHISSIRTLNKLHLSGIKAGLLSFDAIGHVPLTDISLANSNIDNVQKLKLNHMIHLENLRLSNNEITKIGVGYFSNVSALRTLDLSFNKITYLQPGALRDNTMLTMLNVSHNQLATIGYGIFRGLTNLQVFDISFNNIERLQNEQFSEVINLSVLIADNNKIGELTSQLFDGTKLTKLSIGNNPIPCEELVRFQQVVGPPSYEITAIKLDEHNDYNVHGIICKNGKKTHTHYQNINNFDDTDIKLILLDIKNIISEYKGDDNQVSNNKEREYLMALTNEISKSNELKNNEIVKYNDLKNSTEYLLSHLNNLLTRSVNKNDTNILLEKILRVLTMNSIKRSTTSIPLASTNATYDNLVKYINSLKQQLEETIAYEKNNILNDVEAKVSAVNSRLATPVHENLRLNSSNSDSLFTETCVGLILLILVCFVLYKIHKSGMFMRSRIYPSERELTQSMDSPL